MNKQTKYTKIKVINKNDSRLDKFLTNAIKDISRTRIQYIIKHAHVCINNKVITDISYNIKIGDLIKIKIVPKPTQNITAKDFPLNIIYDDEYLAVINKPAGLTVHPGAGNYNDTLVNALLAHYKGSLSSIGGNERPGIVHRLDRNTSGLLIIAKNDITHTKLSKLLQERKIKRTYYCIVWGTPEKMQGTINKNIGRNPKNRKKMSVLAKGGKPAVTHYKALKTFQKKEVALLKCDLETGRTHQIRVHLSHIGYPIIGDPEYGSIRTKRKRSLSQEAIKYINLTKRQMLHAKQLTFIHPITNKLIDLEIDLPEDMKKLIKILSSIE